MAAKTTIRTPVAPKTYLRHSVTDRNPIINGIKAALIILTNCNP
jgi:hypothetical protein